MTQVAVAASSELAAEAGDSIACAGGNAVDAAIAAALVSLTIEPGVASLGAGGFVTLWSPGEDPVVIDGNLAMPGKGLKPDQLGRNAWEVSLDYGGGVATVVGHGSVAVPGGLAALDHSWRQFGSLPWSELVQPALAAARAGFPLGQASYNYLQHSGELIYGWNPDSRKALFDANDKLKGVGETVLVPHLADSLELIASEGATSMYTGGIARLIVQDMAANEGPLTATDLAGYLPVHRQPLMQKMADWQIATNPPPAVGGLSLCAMLSLMGERPVGNWSAENVALAARIQQAVLSYRRKNLDLCDDMNQESQRLLTLCAGLDPAALQSASTIHVSAADKNGLACSLTMSAGYGAGVIPPGTGIWLNNCLGELELNHRGLDIGPPGTRLASNMAPSIARNKKTVLAIGSPGADRITSALMMTLLSLIRLNMSLDEAIAQPRMHFEFNDGQARIAAEPGLDTSAVELPVRHFEQQSMFFGGVGAAQCHEDGSLQAAADSRREGGARVSE